MMQPSPQEIAAWWHLAVFLGIMAGIALMGFHAQQAGPANASATPA